MARAAHRLLKRQIKRYLDGKELPEVCSAFIQAVDEAYHQADVDRAMLERSLEISSEELNEANVELRALFQALPDLCFHLDADDRIVDIKGGTSEDFVIDASRLRGRRIDEVPNAATAAAFREAIVRVRQSRALERIEYQLPVEAQRHHYEARLLPLRGDQIIVVIRNITDQKEAELALEEKAAELTRSNQELEQFAYIASHDLQEPLRTVQSYLQLLQRRYADKLDDDANEFIQFTVDGAKRMRSLINDLLSYARVTSKAQPFVPTPLGALLDEVLASLRVAVVDSSAEVTSTELPEIAVDRRQIAQLLQNLISNAIKFRGECAPRIAISARSNGANWQLSVADNGIGIAPKFRDKVFAIFKRLHGRDEYPGTGIGLAICKKIVERHGGTIWIESEAGEGTTFHFTLPKQREEHHAER